MVDPIRYSNVKDWKFGGHHQHPAQWFSAMSQPNQPSSHLDSQWDDDPCERCLNPRGWLVTRCCSCKSESSIQNTTFLYTMLGFWFSSLRFLKAATGELPRFPQHKSSCSHSQLIELPAAFGLPVRWNNNDQFAVWSASLVMTSTCPKDSTANYVGISKGNMLSTVTLHNDGLLNPDGEHWNLLFLASRWGIRRTLRLSTWINNVTCASPRIQKNKVDWMATVILLWATFHIVKHDRPAITSTMKPLVTQDFVSHLTVHAGYNIYHP